eukprot:NODE_9211_length_612_cov_13.887526_g8579_i0.p1 GENE.NODE_9211_length_612_cov_13.887526_g8579_i0~~NODE_9211_length_612_cov_13.887526_g8579_i0.p1  ORF type:complete len:189 (+),score=31.71 NODE_9211_length_612_cov_13.887526_g8579_i0:53-568(+)
MSISPEELNKLKRPRTPFWFFLDSFKKEKKTNTKEINKEWQNLDPTLKKKYEDESKKDKERYDSEKAQLFASKGLTPPVEENRNNSKKKKREFSEIMQEFDKVIEKDGVKSQPINEDDESRPKKKMKRDSSIDPRDELQRILAVPVSIPRSKPIKKPSQTKRPKPKPKSKR